jgi:hypothetical protein
VALGASTHSVRRARNHRYSFVVLAVASFEPVYAEGGELVELSPRSDLSLVRS